MRKMILDMKHIEKEFGHNRVLKGVDLQIHEGEVISLVGENGAGKSTLMNILFGMPSIVNTGGYKGEVLWDGNPIKLTSPGQAMELGIGMVHQHFKLVDVFTATENIVLGIKDKEKYSLKKAEQRVKEITDKYGFDINLDSKVYEMSVSEKQTVEIVKVLYRGAQTLILDEPTAVLTPQETEKLFDVLRRMKKDGKSIIIITHKLHEVMSLTDRVAVLRKGEYIGTVDTKSATEQSLTEMMVGKKVSLNIERTAPVNPQNRIELKNVTTLNSEGVKAVDDISLDIRSGEILGIAGIAGSGQRELLETIAGLQKPECGEIFYHSPEGETVDLKAKTPTQIKELGVRLSFVPEDRLGMGLVGNMDIIDNMMLRSYKKGNTAFLDRKNPKKLAEKIIESLEVVTPGATTPVRRLSGGNVQKVLVGREIAANPKVLMAAYPVRGLDINSSYTIYNLLTKQKENGVAVVFVGEDLDVLVELCDRIMVINSGKITGMLDGRTATKEEIGLLMTKTEREDS